jgi:uncharacterized protein YqjF (DUF2071 family)
MAQRWNDLLFMHWPVPVQQMRALVPDSLELDLFDGSAWLSVTPFYLSHLRARGSPPVPVRVVVRGGQRPYVRDTQRQTGGVLL